MKSRGAWFGILAAFWLCLPTLAEAQTHSLQKEEKITLHNGRTLCYAPIPERFPKDLTAEEPSPIASPTLANPDEKAIAIAKKRGGETAWRDIQRGKQRILISPPDFFGNLMLEYASKKPFPFVDEATGFPVEVVGRELITQSCLPSPAFLAEVKAYNEMMQSYGKPPSAKE